jgi:polyferredoxin
MSPEPNPMSAPPPPAAKPDFKDFRDHIATADETGRRKWVYARQPKGRFYQRRICVSWLLLGVMFAGPFVRINGNPLLMINIVERRFSILGRIFWPQDMALVAVALLLFFTGIMIFTAAYGRLWCGWVCPQTLLMEMVFRRIEYAIEGDAQAQRKLDAAPWTARKTFIKVFKHLIFFGLSFVISNLLLSYIIGSDALIKIITDSPSRHLAGLAYLLAFTGIFYAIFARFREQACTFICPYGRFQSTVVDENTVVVAYDHKRSDCVHCDLCVAVCPTGIDIRDGIQMECVNCTACIDACDGVMKKVHRPPGLIRYASLNNIERGERFHITPRMCGYGGVLMVLISLFLFLVLTRSNVEATMLRAPGSLFQQLPNGDLINLYTLQLVNKTSQSLPVDLKLENSNGKLSIMGDPNLTVKGEQLAETSILIELPPGAVKSGTAKLEVGVYSNGKRVQTVHTSFIGPRD